MTRYQDTLEGKRALCRLMGHNYKLPYHDNIKFYVVCYYKQCTRCNNKDIYYGDWEKAIESYGEPNEHK